MLVGYNTNISYKEKTYHIQTEDSGKSNPVIVTLLYSQGAILASKKTSYTDFITAPDFKEKVSKLMKIQHKVMIKELLSGKYTGEYHGAEGEAQNKPAKEAKEVRETETLRKPEKTAVRGEEAGTGENTLTVKAPSAEQDNTKKQITNSLDDILLNYIMKRAK
jgi:hypothetical protein